MPSESTLKDKQRRTRALLVAAARRRTAEGGIGSFTVQELCDEVGLSRRSFFNYFPSKESAVLGIENGVDEEHLESFLDARGVAREKRRDLVADLYDLVIDHFDAMGPKASDITELMAAFKAEPKLMTAFHESGQREQRRFVTMLSERDDSVDVESAEVALVVFESLVRVSVEAFFRDGDGRPFSEILQSRIVAARALLAGATQPPASEKAPTHTKPATTSSTATTSTTELVTTP